MLLKVKEPYHRQSEVKKYLHWSMIRKKTSYWEEFKESEALADKYDSFHNVSSWWVWGHAAQPQEKFAIHTLIYVWKQYFHINDWYIPFPKVLRIYQWIGKNIFHWRKWNEPIVNSAYPAECLTKRSWRDIFLAW